MCSERLRGMGSYSYPSHRPGGFKSSAMPYASKGIHLCRLPIVRKRCTCDRLHAARIACWDGERTGVGPANNGCLSGGLQAVKQALRAHRPDSDTVCDQNFTSNDRWGSPIMDLHLLASGLGRSLSISNDGWPDWRR